MTAEDELRRERARRQEAERMLCDATNALSLVVKYGAKIPADIWQKTRQNPEIVPYQTKYTREFIEIECSNDW